jgi:peptidoglycan/LPS O-acetylase OafA/YrhL
MSQQVLRASVEGAPLREDREARPAVRPSSNYVPVFDGVRFIAISLVLLKHVPRIADGAPSPRMPLVAAFNRVQDVGWIGVDLF